MPRGLSASRPTILPAPILRLPGSESVSSGRRGRRRARRSGRAGRSPRSPDKRNRRAPIRAATPSRRGRRAARACRGRRRGQAGGDRAFGRSPRARLLSRPHRATPARFTPGIASVRRLGSGHCGVVRATMSLLSFSSRTPWAPPRSPPTASVPFERPRDARCRGRRRRHERLRSLPSMVTVARTGASSERVRRRNGEQAVGDLQRPSPGVTRALPLTPTCGGAASSVRSRRSTR